MEQSAAARDPAKRRRGRPRENLDDQDSALKVRRQRNREAQQLFRDRKQAALKQEQKYMESLEDSVDQLNSVLIGLTDDLLKRDSIQKDAGAMRLLRSAMDQFVSVAQKREQEDSNSGEGPSCPTDAKCPPGSDPNSTGEDFLRWSPSLHHGKMPIQTKQEDFTPPDWAAGNFIDDDNDDSSCLAQLQAAEQHHDDHLVYMEDLTAQADAALVAATAAGRSGRIRNIFGNGWTGPPAMASHFTMRGGTDQPALDGLACQLIRSGFVCIYDSLLHDYANPNAIWRPVMQFAIQFHTRQDLLYASRWYLGPGTHEMFRLANVALIDGKSYTLGTSEALNPALDLVTLAAVTVPGTQGQELGAGPLLNAWDVEKYLTKKGGRRVFPGVMEFPRPSQPTDAVGFLDPHVFFPGDWTQQNRRPSISAGPAAQVIRVSQDLLLRNLTSICLCLAQGPTYQRDLIDAAIMAAAVWC